MRGLSFCGLGDTGKRFSFSGIEYEQGRIPRQKKGRRKRKGRVGPFTEVLIICLRIKKKLRASGEDALDDFPFLGRSDQSLV